MSERRWTVDQLRAIESVKKDLILSAAAGSGKTATLTERIIRLLKDKEKNANLSRMLIVTFTRAAAGELNDRIGTALFDALAADPQNKFLASQLTALEGAHISTIDSFFQGEIRSHFQALSLPPDFRVADEAESAALREEIMEETLGELFDGLYSIDMEELSGFADCLSDARTQGDLSRVLLDITSALISHDISNEDLLANASELLESEGDLFATSYSDSVKERLLAISRYYSQRFERAVQELSVMEKGEKYVEGASKTLGDVRELSKLCHLSYAEARERLNCFALPTLAKFTGVQPDEYISYKDLRTELMKIIKKLRESCFADDPSGIARGMALTGKYLRILAFVNRIFREKYRLAKTEKGIIDFADGALLARELFVNPDGTPTALALETGSKFDYVFIDEYQDTNKIQDEIFTAITGSACRFMVGDVKQSIYGFRGSKPELFSGYREKYREGENSEAVFMSENFRSDKNVLDFANIISRYMFSTDATPFEKEDELICSKANGETDKKCEVILCGRSTDEKPLPDEAQSVAMRISELLAYETLADGSRVRPKDIVILLRSATHAEDYQRELAKRGIPVNNSISDDFFNYSEVLFILCLLNTADNPLRDIYLAGSMKSHVFGFTLGDLVRIRRNSGIPLWYSVLEYIENGSDGALCEKCKELVRYVDRWRDAAREMRADEILRLIISDTSLRSFSGDSVRTNRDIVRTLKILTDHAVAVGNNGGVLHDLIDHLNGLIERPDKAESFADTDSVSIMSIHKSKGLEFPVCILCELSKPFNKTDTYDKLIMDKQGRIGMKLYDGKGLVRCDTAMRGALAVGMVRDDLYEEARVLYVAMTRAREKLILTASVKDMEDTLAAAEKNSEYPLCSYEIMSAKCTGEWVFNALKRDASGKCYIYRSSESLCDYPFEREAKGEGSSELGAFFEKTIDFSYDKEYLENVPSKLSVSVLKPDILGSGDEEQISFGEKRAEVLPENAPLPRFLMDKEVATGAMRGTATHIFMQFCNFALLNENGAEAELKRLKDMKFISEADAALVRLGEIELFAGSELFARLLRAKRIIRERRFNTVLPAADFTENDVLKKKLREDGTLITVQGVVDCIFIDEDGNAVLVDYKTDRLTEEELADVKKAEEKLISRHRRQLMIYKDICEDMIGQPFSEVCIYSVHLGKCISMI